MQRSDYPVPNKGSK